MSSYSKYTVTDTVIASSERAMTTEQYRKWLKTQLLELAVAKYPNNIHLQLIYQIGFLEQQLANTMRHDSRRADEFKQCIDSANDQLKDL
jgi:hydroxymethylpyrimidine/phosphomethylpyrimidine kinase